MFWLNCFPHKDGIHLALSPRTIVTGLTINYNKCCKLKFGKYVQVVNQHDNSMIPRTSGAIVLHSTGNSQGSYYFLSLHSGKHTMMTLGKGVSYSTLCKQKLNTKSSTEAELIAIIDEMGQILWTRHFLAAQDAPVPTTMIYQDNKSTILLAENGSASSSKRTRHLNVWYYFVTDKIKKARYR